MVILSRQLSRMPSFAINHRQKRQNSIDKSKYDTDKERKNTTGKRCINKENNRNIFLWTKRQKRIFTAKRKFSEKHLLFASSKLRAFKHKTPSVFSCKFVISFLREHFYSANSYFCVNFMYNSIFFFFSVLFFSIQFVFWLVLVSFGYL